MKIFKIRLNLQSVKEILDFLHYTFPSAVRSILQIKLEYGGTPNILFGTAFRIHFHFWIQLLHDIVHRKFLRNCTKMQFSKQICTNLLYDWWIVAGAVLRNGKYLSFSLWICVFLWSLAGNFIRRRNIKDAQSRKTIRRRRRARESKSIACKCRKPCDVTLFNVYTILLISTTCQVRGFSCDIYL